jgi:hypothetical protein
LRLEDTASKVSVAFVFAGSYGDFEPLNGVLCALGEKCDIVVYKPADVKLPIKCKSFDYVDTYKPFVHGNNKGDVKLIDHIVTCMKKLSSTYDYVIGPHFSREMEMLKANVKYIKLYPLLEPWKRTVFEDMGVWLGLTKSFMEEKKTRASQLCT